ncbi:thioredoxin domain-containing protein [Subsaxibacter sp. CAU 1640]|uniref:thioredoxin domain-containing protein n=1 Tax=Subsaxibacter sp. CAU 1640 TaxID=2933271 RepID=UPI00200418AF|nr:thioredoxin domain-containing protein [Subsaxibacter sp. CAU 1640]MCK7589821.1 thioredoxin domain-containing protein [Subsaxibacter sp. CAU 1640]
MNKKRSNKLIEETSPYLLQHAENPIDWHAWNENTLKLANTSGKLIVISIGYSACHWCHVMEHESFEDDDVAALMNQNYINIKVDREERPDIDQVYMNAIQLITGSGGWPLNIVALPDGRPVWGGTYFKKEIWMNALNQISNLYKTKPEKLFDYADKLEQGLKNIDLITLNPNTDDFSTEFIQQTIDNWSHQFDYRFGGMSRAPKFMMPNNYQFLLRYAYQMNDLPLQEYVNTTLTKMAFGGIFDHIGGGFSRYSVDEKWHVPHFEKMLYDNAQMVSLYAEAFLITKNNLYKDVVIETLNFVDRELKGPHGNFYSSLDADSLNHEGTLEEGAYYVWNQNELKSLLKEDFGLFADYYNVNAYGFWEEGNYVLIRSEDDDSFLKKHELTSESLFKRKENWKDILLKARQKRKPPRLDDKTLTSWNAMMIKGYLDAYRVLKEEPYLHTATTCGEFLLKNQIREDGGLNHNFKNGTSNINGFLEDYATCIDAFISLYNHTLDLKWLFISRDLTNYCFDFFFDDQSKLFFFTSEKDTALVSRSVEYRDNVIPASNSTMAKNLFTLSHYFDNEHYAKTAETMLNNIKPEIQNYGSGFSNWLYLMMNYTEPFFEVAIIGNESLEKIKELNLNYTPNKIVAASFKEESLPLFKNRAVEGKTLIYVCVNKTCNMPVDTVEKAINQLKKYP